MYLGNVWTVMSRDAAPGELPEQSTVPRATATPGEGGASAGYAPIRVAVGVLEAADRRFDGRSIVANLHRLASAPKHSKSP